MEWFSFVAGGAPKTTEYRRLSDIQSVSASEGTLSIMLTDGYLIQVACNSAEEVAGRLLRGEGPTLKKGEAGIKGVDYRKGRPATFQMLSSGRTTFL